MLNTPDDFGIGPSIVYSSEYMVVLQSFVPSAEILRKNGHVLEQLSDLELHGKKRCQGCGKCESAYTLPIIKDDFIDYESY